MMMPNYCQAGHTSHKWKLVESQQGAMVIYDYEKYFGFAGYCPGQDDVSRTIALYGKWDDDNTSLIASILSNGQHNLFLDVGCNIGWFCKLARNLGVSAIGFDGILEHLEIAKTNAPAAYHNIWFDKDTKPTDTLYHADLIKIDVEGSEQYALNYFENSFDCGFINNAIIEITPVFNDSYPALVQRMMDWGFKVFRDGKPWDGKFDFQQTDFLFKKKEGFEALQHLLINSSLK